MSKDTRRLLYSAGNNTKLRAVGDESDLVVYAVHLAGTRAHDHRIIMMEAAHPLALDPEPLHRNELQTGQRFGVAIDGNCREALMKMLPIGKRSQRSETAGERKVGADHRSLRGSAVRLQKCPILPLFTRP